MKMEEPTKEELIERNTLANKIASKTFTFLFESLFEEIKALNKTREVNFSEVADIVCYGLSSINFNVIEYLGDYYSDKEETKKEDTKFLEEYLFFCLNKVFNREAGKH